MTEAELARDLHGVLAKVQQGVEGVVEFVVVAGLLAASEGWRRFKSQWRSILREHDVPYSHMRELTQFRGPFEKWKGKESRRQQFIGDICDAHHGEIPFGVRFWLLDAEEWLQELHLSGAQGSDGQRVCLPRTVLHGAVCCLGESEQTA